MGLAVAFDGRLSRLQPDQLFDRRRRPATGPRLQQLAEQNERDDCR